MLTKIAQQQRGSVTVEYLFMFPLFVVTIFAFLELCLMWRDHHILRLANFEVARLYSLSKLSDPCNDKKIEKFAHRTAISRTAMIEWNPVFSAIETKVDCVKMPVNSTDAEYIEVSVEYLRSSHMPLPLSWNLTRPLKSKLKIRKPKFNRQDQEWDSGRALGVAPFAFGTTGTQNWDEWVKAMSTTSIK